MAALGWISFFVCLSCLLVVFGVAAVLLFFRSRIRRIVPAPPRDSAIEADYVLVEQEPLSYTITSIDAESVLVPKDEPSCSD